MNQTSRDRLRTDSLDFVSSPYEAVLLTSHAARATRYKVVRLSLYTATIQELLRGPGIEERLLADPTTRVAMLSSLGDAYLNLWQARRERVAGDGKNSSRTRTDIKRGFECRLDVSTERAELLHQAQRLFEDALATPESLNDPAIQVQVGKSDTGPYRLQKKS